MERGVQRKLHAPCEWGEKPEAKSQGLTYPYPTSAGTLTLESYQSLRVFTVELHGSKNAVSGWITAPSPNQE